NTIVSYLEVGALLKYKITCVHGRASGKRLIPCLLTTSKFNFRSSLQTTSVSQTLPIYLRVCIHTSFFLHRLCDEVIPKLKVACLRNCLREASEKVSGNKAELAQRLRVALLKRRPGSSDYEAIKATIYAYAKIPYVT